MHTREEVIDRLERFLGNHQIYDDDAVEDAVNFLDNEKTPEDMLSALAAVGDMDVSELIHYFKIDLPIKSSFDALYLLVKDGTPDMIFDTVEKYKEEKYKEKMTAMKMKVQRLADEIGLNNLKSFISKIEEEKNNAANRR